MHKPSLPKLNFRIRAVVFCTVLFGFIGLSLPYPIFSPMLLSKTYGLFGPSVSNQVRLILLGISLAAYPTGQFLGSPILGRLSDHYGRKPVLILSLCVTTICYLGIGFAIRLFLFWIILLCLFIAGFSEGNVAIAQSTTADLGAYREKAKNFSSINIATNIGWIIGPLISGKLADSALVSWFTYSTPFYFAFLLGIGNILFVIAAFPNYKIAQISKHPAWKDLFSTFVKNIKRPDLRIFFVYTLLGFLSVFFYFYYYAPFMVERFQFGPSQIANFTAYMSIPLIIANYLIRYLMPHWGLVKLGIYSHFILAAAIIIFILPKSANALWFTILPIGFMITVSEISSAVLVSNAAGEHEQGTIMGVYRSLQVLTELLAALFGGLLASINIHAPFIVSCGFAILAALLLIFFKSALTKKDVLKNHREI